MASKKIGIGMKLVCLNRNINNPTLNQISKEVSKLDNKDYFHSTLYLDETNKKYIRVHLNIKDKYILIYCDGLTDNYLREEKGEYTLNEIIDFIDKAMNDDFSWVDDYSWAIFKRGDSLKGILKSIIKIVIVSSLTIYLSLLSIKYNFNFNFYFGLIVLIFPIVNKLIDYFRTKKSRILGAQKILNNLWKKFMFPSAFFVIAKDVQLRQFWFILSYVFIFFILTELFVLIVYQLTKPYSGNSSKPAFYAVKKIKSNIGFIIFRIIFLIMWLVSSGVLIFKF